MSDVEILCSWCGVEPAVGEDHWHEAPTCAKCALLVTVHPFGWWAEMRRRDAAIAGESRGQSRGNRGDS